MYRFDSSSTGAFTFVDLIDLAVEVDQDLVRFIHDRYDATQVCMDDLVSIITRSFVVLESEKTMGSDQWSYLYREGGVHGAVIAVNDSAIEVCIGSGRSIFIKGGGPWFVISGRGFKKRWFKQYDVFGHLLSALVHNWLSVDINLVSAFNGQFDCLNGIMEDV